LSSITSHVLDTAAGRPAAGITVVVAIGIGADRWTELGRGITDDKGRIARFDPQLAPLEKGLYRLRFLTAAYYKATGVSGFYPEVDVTIEIADPAQHYHIPLLLSPYGYTTYRGS
jgi:5-hydroxyisourate hydrolase